MEGSSRSNAVRVKVAVVVPQTTADMEGKDQLVVSEDGDSVKYTPEKNETTYLSFDQIVNAETIQNLHSELLQPLTESVSCGYNGSLLRGGVHRTEDCSIVKQMLTSLFSNTSLAPNGEVFTTVSFLQFYPDNSAVDLLTTSRQDLRPMLHPVLGCCIGGICELPVSTGEEAYAVYETGRETLRTNGNTLTGRCTSLFTVHVERRFSADEGQGQELCCSRLQFFDLAGGASKTDLRGVSPLVKVLEQLQSGATSSNHLLPFLLTDALRGNNRTVLLYFIQPKGLPDKETPAALALARRIRGLVTKATHGRWCPRATELVIRDSIRELRTRVMSQGEGGVEDTHRLAELTQSLQIVKDHSWERRRETSAQMKVKTKVITAEHKVSKERMAYLRQQLRHEMEEHIREGKGGTEIVQERVTRIKQLREALREEAEGQGVSRETSEHSLQLQNSHLEYTTAKERRRRLKEDHGEMIQEEVNKMERELAQEQVEGPQRQLLVLDRERQVLVLQMEALRAEALQAEKDLEAQHDRHQQEMHSFREESLQVFRVFRQVCEEQRSASEGRYRSLLLEAVQDAVYLSAQNQQLQEDNKQLCIAPEERKNVIAVRSEPKTS